MTESPAIRPPLDTQRLADLAPRWQVEVVDATPSTNAVAAERVKAGAPAGLVVVTEHQTAGRGRLDRGWQTPDRSALTFSMTLRAPEVPAQRWPWLPLATGIGVVDTLRDRGFAAGLKWPNDVLIARGDDLLKVCGILLERVEVPTSSTTGDAGPVAVIGVGLNTTQTADELPVPTATSLAIESGGPIDRTELLVGLLERLDGILTTWVRSPAELAARYRELSVTIGRPVRAELPGGDVITGTATDIDADGRLVIDGTHVVGAGDVIHARLQ